MPTPQLPMPIGYIEALHPVFVVDVSFTMNAYRRLEMIQVLIWKLVILEGSYCPALLVCSADPILRVPIRFKDPLCGVC